MDLVSLFALVVFVLAWVFYARTPADETLGRLFFATLLFLGAAIGVLGMINRLSVP